MSPATTSGRRRAAHRRRRPDADDRSGRLNRLEALPPAFLIVVALLLGGSTNPLGDLAIQLVAVAVLAILVIRFSKEEWQRSRLGWAVVAVTLLVALIELVPLPYGAWRALPGRQGPASLLDALALSGGARPLSLDANATVATLIQIIPGIVAFIAALAAGTRTRQAWTAILIAGACVCVVLGALQITGQSQFYLYTQSHFGNVTGLFANHNHAADMFLIGIALLAGRLGRTRPGMLGQRIVLLALMMTMAVSTLLTASRFGMVLLAVETLVIAIALRPLMGRRGWLVIAAIVVAGAAGVGLLTLSSSVSHAIDRFNQLPEDLRPEIWRRSLDAARRYWPVGSGLGTFVPVYQSVERIDLLPQQIVNHAHNEYIELILEMGLAGLLLIVGYLASLATLVARRFRQFNDSHVIAAGLGLLVLLIHSFVEFPLRNASLMVTFGLLNGILFGAMRKKPAEEP